MSEDLIAQRDRLLEKFTVMQADLGGAFYEMAIRDHVRMDALTRKAAELQRVDAELLKVERLLELERDDAAGACPSCGAPFGPAVRFCSQCGHSLGAEEADQARQASKAEEKSEVRA
jgi:NADH pyrophosphatase NudC (nudix superfamily)